MFSISTFSNKKVHSVQSTRVGGFSSAPYDSLNLGPFTDDPMVEKNLNKVRTDKNLPHVPVMLKQVHGKKVIEYTEPPHSHGQWSADACFTREPGVVCSVLTADCLPVLLASKTENLVAAIHCGWKGLHANIIAETLNFMQTDNSDLEAWLGPCISYKAYVVGEELREKFVKADPQNAHAFYLDSKNKWHADLKKIAQMQLQQLGVESLSQSPFCTYENSSMFYSYRKKPQTGRMASMIWLQP